MINVKRVVIEQRLTPKVSGYFKSNIPTQIYTYGNGYYRTWWQDTETFLLTKALSSTIFPDTMQRCDILQYANFGEISSSFWKDPSLEFTDYAVKLYRYTVIMSSLITRHFQFLFKSPKTHVTFDQNVIFRTLVIIKRTKCKVYISEIRGVKSTKTLKTWWRDVNNVTWVFGLSPSDMM